MSQELLADLTLAQAIQLEGEQFIDYLNNKIRIAVLLVCDVWNGKKRQLLNAPRIEETPETSTAGFSEQPTDDHADGRKEGVRKEHPTA